MILIALAEQPSRKRIKKEPKIKTEIDVGIQGWQDRDVEQLPESESWRGVGRHQVRGRLEEIWKDTVLERVISIWEIVSFNVAITGNIEVSILSTSLRLLMKYKVLIEDAEEAEEFLEAEKVDEFLEALRWMNSLMPQKHSWFKILYFINQI